MTDVDSTMTDADLSDWNKRIKVRIKVDGPEAWQFRVEDAETGRLIPCRALRLELDPTGDMTWLRADLLVEEADLTILADIKLWKEPENGSA